MVSAGAKAQAGAPAQPASALLMRAIASTGEQIPAVGLGSWVTFNVGDDQAARSQCAGVMQAFFDSGGRLVDSSPMYGSSQGVIGDGLRQLGAQAPVFSADKVWTSSAGAAQIETSRQLWRVQKFDLLQVHNLLAWQEHLPLLQAMKSAGKLRYVGITTSEGRRHRDLEQIMRTQRIDFVQLSYNLLDREVEEQLLPLAQDRGIAVLVNRPFR
jgi:diketogulonate reductase-like aldo/keto reductase